MDRAEEDDHFDYLSALKTIANSGGAHSEALPKKSSQHIVVDISDDSEEDINNASDEDVVSPQDISRVKPLVVETRDISKTTAKEKPQERRQSTDSSADNVLKVVPKEFPKDVPSVVTTKREVKADANETPQQSAQDVKPCVDRKPIRGFGQRFMEAMKQRASGVTVKSEVKPKLEPFDRKPNVKPVFGSDIKCFAGIKSETAVKHESSHDSKDTKPSVARDGQSVANTSQSSTDTASETVESQPYTGGDTSDDVDSDDTNGTLDSDWDADNTSDTDSGQQLDTPSDSNILIAIQRVKSMHQKPTFERIFKQFSKPQTNCLVSEKMLDFRNAINDAMKRSVIKKV
ncbi:unnamed protein product, partial [Oppiella nova]